MSVSAISLKILEHVRKIIPKIKFNHKKKYVEMYVQSQKQPSMMNQLSILGIFGSNSQPTGPNYILSVVTSPICHGKAARESHMVVRGLF